MKKIIPAGILIVLLIISVFVGKWYLNKPNIPELYKVPAFEFENQDGKPFTNANFANRISVVDFIFTNCPGICPMMSRKLASVYEDYSGDDGVQFISFSVDPARDSLQALQAYAKRWGVTDQRWQFIRTEKDAISKLYSEGFKLGGELPYGHSGSIILVDQNGVIRGYYNFDDDEAFARMESDLSALEGNL